MDEQPTAGVTELLQAWSAGDATARDRLVRTVYADLHRRAAACLRRERRGHTLQPTALINEAYLRLAMENRTAWKNREQFFGVAAQLMRWILVDHARAGKRSKRSGQLVRVTLDEHLLRGEAPNVDLLALDEALTRLAAFDKRKSTIAELRFFAGLSLSETAHLLGISVATVEREWQAARAWLYTALKA
jgi:RNA polymerase sigma-70 factor (ECF subfamily)